MIMSPRVRRFALTAHVVSSVGWLGAVAVALALAVIGLTSRDAELVLSTYLVLEPIGWFVLVPLSVASLLTGLVQSLGTKWGLLRHYWVLTKLAINLVASVVLLMYMQTLGSLADVAAATASGADRAALSSPSAVLHAGAALVLLLAAAALSVYKPPGLTRYGWRKQQGLRAAAQP